MADTLVIDGKQLRRLMKLCRTISNGRGATVQQLQARLKTSRRTIFRDLDSLKTLGIRVELGEHGYRIRQNAASCKKLLIDRHLKDLNKLLATCLK